MFFGKIEGHVPWVEEVAVGRKIGGGKSGLRRAGRPAVKAGTALLYRR